MKSLLAAALGVILGFVFLLVFIVGIAAGYTTRLAARAAAPVYPGAFAGSAVVQIEGNDDLGSIESEFTRFLGSSRVDRGLYVTEAGLSRFAAAFLRESSFDAEILPQRVGLDLEPNRVTGLYSFLSPESTPTFLTPRGTRIPITVIVAAAVVQVEDELHFELERVILGQVELPLGAVRWAAERFSNQPFRQSVPLSEMDGAFSGMFSVRALEVGKDVLDITLSPDEEFYRELLGGFRVVFQRDGGRIEAVLARYISDPAVLAGATRAMRDVAQQEPSERLFWQTAEAARQLAAHTGTMDQEAVQAMLNDLAEIVDMEAMAAQLEVQ